MARGDAPVPSRASGSPSLWTLRCAPGIKADLDFIATALGKTASAVVRELISARAAELRAARTAQLVHAQRERTADCPTCGAPVFPGAALHECPRCGLCHEPLLYRLPHRCPAWRLSTW
jgi:hypothetical protein